MKRTISMFTAMLLFCAILVLPAYAVEETEQGRNSHYYPISVDEYIGGDFDEPRIQKVYQLSLDDDPAKIPTEDFIRSGRLYYLLDMTRQDEIGVDTRSHVQTVTLPRRPMIWRKFSRYWMLKSKQQRRTDTPGRFIWTIPPSR